MMDLKWLQADLKTLAQLGELSALLQGFTESAGTDNHSVRDLSERLTKIARIAKKAQKGIQATLCRPKTAARFEASRPLTMTGMRDISRAHPKLIERERQKRYAKRRGDDV